MNYVRSNILNLRPGEWQLVAALLVLLGINAVVLEISDVVATSGFISTVGVSQIPVLWIVDMVIALLSSIAYSAVVDRVPRLRIVSWLLVLLAFFYLAIQVLFVYGAPDWVTYPLLYIVSDQQLALFPLAFWALANDLYSMSETKRLFPLIAAGAAIGRIAGNGIAAATANLFSEPEGSHISALLVLGSVVFIAGLGLLWITFYKRPVRARQDQQNEGLRREAFSEGIETIRDVPILRYLAITMTLAFLALTVLEYHFLVTMDQAFVGNQSGIQSYYGYYKIVLIIATLLFQWLITGRMLEKVGMKNNFVVLPATLMMSVASALAVPGLVGGTVARFIARLIEWSWDEPVRKSAEGLIPDERRGRVSAFIDSYIYAASTIIGSVLLVILLLITSQGWLPSAYITWIYLGVAMAAAFGAVAMALRLRGVYEKSLLNWRLSRSRRKSVLDNIEF